MKPSDDLHKLVKSMSKAEKIYFKKFSKRHIIGESNKYVRLFNEIEKQNTYDEESVIKRFKGDKFVNQIHVAKNYLFELILRSLSIFHSEKDIDFSLYDDIKKIRILIDKNMIKSASKLIQKAKKTAQKTHNNEILYKLLEIESNLTAVKYDAKAQPELEKLSRLKSETLNQLENTSKYNSINSMLNLLSARWSYSRDPEDVKMIKKILNDPLVKNEGNAKGFTSRYMLFSIKAKLYRFLLDDDKGLHYRKMIIELMEEYPDSIIESPEKYIARLHEFINYSLGTETGAAKNYPIEQYLDKMKRHLEIVASGKKSKTVKSLSWYLYYQMKIGYYYTKVDKEGFYKTMLSINNEIDIYRDSLRKRYLFNLYIYCSLFYFEFGDYRESLKWLTLFLNNKDAPNYEEIYHNLMMFSIILHFELGDYDLAEALINNTKRYYRKGEKLYESERVLLHYLRKLLSKSGEVETNDIFEELKIKLAELSGKESEKRFLNSFDFRRWVDKKLGLLKESN